MAGNITLRVIRAEVTVAQKLNQGSFPKTGCNPCQPAGWVFGWLLVTFSTKSNRKAKPKV
jgi:hypothetical protein